MSVQYKSILESVRNPSVSIHTDVNIFYGLLYHSLGTCLINQRSLLHSHKMQWFILIHLLTITQYWESSLTVLEKSDKLNHDITGQLSFKKQGGRSFKMQPKRNAIRIRGVPCIFKNHSLTTCYQLACVIMCWELRWSQMDNKNIFLNPTL